MSKTFDLVISTFKDNHKIKEIIFDFDDLTNFDLIYKIEDGFSYTFFNNGCDEITIHLNKETIIKKEEGISFSSLDEFGKMPLYRLSLRKNDIEKDVVLEVNDDSYILSEAHLALKSWIVSTNHFDKEKVFEDKIRLNDHFYKMERMKLDTIKKSNDNIHAFLFALNELKNNLSFETKKTLIKKSDIIKNDPFIDFKHSEYIEIDKDFVFGHVKKYVCPENVILAKSLVSLSKSVTILKSLIFLFIKRMNSEIVAYNSLIKSEKRKNLSKTNALKLSSLYKGKKESISELNKLLIRLDENIALILKELGEECIDFKYESIASNLSKNKYYKKVFALLSNQMSFNIDYDFIRNELVHVNKKFMLTELVSFYSFIAIDKILNELEYYSDETKHIKMDKLTPKEIVYEGNKYSISLGFLKPKRKTSENDNRDYMPTFILKVLYDSKDVMKVLVIDEYTEILNSSEVNKTHDEDFVFLKQDISRLYFDDSLINEYYKVVCRNANKFRNDYTYNFRNCDTYILSLYKKLKRIILEFLEDYTVGEENIFID